MSVDSFRGFLWASLLEIFLAVITALDICLHSNVSFYFHICVTTESMPRFWRLLYCLGRFLSVSTYLRHKEGKQEWMIQQFRFFRNLTSNQELWMIIQNLSENSESQEWRTFSYCATTVQLSIPIRRDVSNVSRDFFMIQKDVDEISSPLAVRLLATDLLCAW